MAMALGILTFGGPIRDVFLYDTFTGMVKPTDHDVSLKEEKASEYFDQCKIGEDRSNWCFASLDDVRNNMALVDYPAERIHYIKGKVEDTLLETRPEKISLLRLDTDWYESTRFELEHLYPRLVKGGVLIIDDYGHWKGAKKAVDEYFGKQGSVFLNRIDYTGRLLVKAD